MPERLNPLADTPQTEAALDEVLRFFDQLSESEFLEVMIENLFADVVSDTTENPMGAKLKMYLGRRMQTILTQIKVIEKQANAIRAAINKDPGREPNDAGAQ